MPHRGETKAQGATVLSTVLDFTFLIVIEYPMENGFEYPMENGFRLGIDSIFVCAALRSFGGVPVRYGASRRSDP